MRNRISVFLITLSGLILEVGLTRIYSASIWYHFAFVAISVALLGWGLGGFTVHLLKKVRPMTMNAAAVVTILYALAIPLCLWLLVRYPFDMDRLPLYFLAPLLPFFLAGMALSIIFDIHRAESGSLYFYDLVGAALGAVLVTLLLHVFGGEAALLVGSIAPACAALLISLSASAKTVRVATVIALLITSAAAFSAIKFGAFRVKPGTTKAMRNQMDAAPGSRVTQTGWNSYSRIDAVEGVERSRGGKIELERRRGRSGGKEAPRTTMRTTVLTTLRAPKGGGTQQLGGMRRLLGLLAEAAPPK